MTPESFIWWLHGYLEISQAKTIGPNETQIIKDHLKLFFNKVTPNKTLGYDFSIDPCGQDGQKQPIKSIQSIPGFSFFDNQDIKYCSTSKVSDMSLGVTYNTMFASC